MEISVQAVIMDVENRAVGLETEAMSALYQDPNWSKQDIQKLIKEEQKQMTKKFSSAFSSEKIEYYEKEKEEKQKAGYVHSLSDMSGLVIEHLIFGTETTYRLSDQKKTVNEGQNPFPIYTAVNKKEDIKDVESESEWCEFTPYEVGLIKYGAFVRTEDFGSHFFLGHRVNKLPELRLPYLIGIWSSAFSLSVSEVLDFVIGPPPKSDESDEDNKETPKPKDEESKASSSSGLIVKRPVSRMTRMIHNLFSRRPLVAEMSNYMLGLFMHKDYDKDSKFLAWKGQSLQNNDQTDSDSSKEEHSLVLSEEKHPDSYPNELTPSDPTLRLVDAGLSINIGCAPILRPERKADLIIILSYSWDKDPLAVVNLTSDYCQAHQIPFPDVDETLPKQEAYVFEDKDKDKDEPEAPIVIHFPLVNVTYRDYKAPGVKRETLKERKAGRLDANKYSTRHLIYEKKHYDALVKLTHYNVINNEDKVLNVIRQVVNRKMEKRQDK